MYNWQGQQQESATWKSHYMVYGNYHAY